jgi:hypothetical protein
MVSPPESGNSQTPAVAYEVPFLDSIPQIPQEILKSPPESGNHPSRALPI